MREQSYYRLIDVEANNRSDESVPILVNCVGYAYLKQPFKTATARADYYLQFMDKGKLNMKRGGEDTVFTAGQFIIHKAGIPYEYTLADDEMGYYWVHFTGSYPEMLTARAGLEFGRIYTLSENGAHPERIFSNMFREFMIRGRAFEDSCAALLVSLITELARMTENTAAESSSDEKTRFSKSLAFIHKNYASDIRIDTLAEMEHLSISRYRDVFRRITGMSPLDYIISLRIQRACELLAATDYTVTQISSICGYSDVLYFIRLFRQKMGVTPGVYRGR